MGLAINCNHNLPCYISILSDLHNLAFTASQVYIKPIGLHVRVRFNSKKMSPANFSSRLNNRLKKRGGHSKVSVKELDESGAHYHYALVIEGKHCTRANIHHLLATLQKSGYVRDYHVASHAFDYHGIDLRYPRACAVYFHWISYLAKVRTKPESGQKRSSSRPRKLKRKPTCALKPESLDSLKRPRTTIIQYKSKPLVIISPSSAHNTVGQNPVISAVDLTEFMT